MQDKSNFSPMYFAFQWHITDRCNWHCQHCYQEPNRLASELGLKDLLRIFRQYLNLIKHFKTIGPEYTRLVLAGGEPLCKKEIFNLLEKIYKYNKYFLLIMLSNGSLINKNIAGRLNCLGVKKFQVSLEGRQKNNDAVRGKGAFRATLNAIEALVSSGVETAVSMTLTKNNKQDIYYLAKLCERIGVSQFAVRRLVPMGNARHLRNELLEPLELKETYLDFEEMKGNFKRNGFKLKYMLRGCDESIFSEDTEKPLIKCGVIESRILTVGPDADVYPCRRLPIKLGNALKEELLDIYYHSPVLKRLRNLNNSFDLCRECDNFFSCLSGAKCVSYAYFNKFSVPDPQCWKLFKKLPDPAKYRLLHEKKERQASVFLSLRMNKLFHKIRNHG